MMTVLGILIFSAAFGGAVWAMAATIAPRFDRIVDALAGRPQTEFQPLSVLVRAERRIAVNRPMAVSRPAVRMLEAA